MERQNEKVKQLVRNIEDKESIQLLFVEQEREIVGRGNESSEGKS